MAISTYTLFVIIGCGIVTFIPRVLPFIFVRKLALPDIVIRFLSFVPLAILTALFVQSLLTTSKNAFPVINMENLLASLPTIITAILTKNLMWIVIVGIISMAVIRLIL
ncbi:AzlD domain-containing protein [Listeria sp. FSL L7-1485]|uniref:AzlD domain-containing protein n=1 Tax=Listeria immobilis TaxID=2713502 RepID=A0A7X0X7W4_9LIST|nr:AzlD domain-containing protein [Listeria immobilis]MBC1483861.1 AzlD domain-containing protein [Listeria immobilis]MBC1489205.1 AzlD domain-containing protein [Listeria immobilis]MBC1507559.1 AzlD domain-containing protein [Listeria immobilis]MBC1510424.1 AzlD domain-containing protein [Listeria immobilis]MBC1515102.1 AzlD domain-containing protein [Listeria immobilis]